MYHILWVRRFRDHTNPGRRFNLFKPLRRHFRAASVLPYGSLAPAIRRPKRLRFKRSTIGVGSPRGTAALGGLYFAASRAIIFSFHEFSMLCSQDNFRARGERCRDQIRCGGAELVRLGGVHFLASREDTRAKISAFREFSMLCRQENFRAPGSRKSRYETSAAKPPLPTIGCPRAKSQSSSVGSLVHHPPS